MQKKMTNTAQEEYLMGSNANLLCTRCDAKDFTLKKSFYDHQQAAPFLLWFLDIQFRCYIKQHMYTHEEASSAN